MDDIWSILEIEATRDTAAIKSAYARMAAQYHPEEQPELFLRLRQAYQAALAYAAPRTRAPRRRSAPPPGASIWGRKRRKMLSGTGRPTGPSWTCTAARAAGIRPNG